MLFVQVNSEAVAPGEALITHVALVASSKTPLISRHRPMKNYTFEEKTNNNVIFSPFYLMLSFVVKLHGAQGARGEDAAGNVTVKSWFAAVGIKMFAQVYQILTPWRKKRKKKKKSISETSNIVQAASAALVSEQVTWYLYSQQSQLYGFSLLWRNLI